MALFRKKPVVIEAIQYRGYNAKEIIDFSNGIIITNTGYSHLSIPTLEGDMRADVADWVIKGVNGEFYPCKPDIFEKTYELADNNRVPKAISILKDALKDESYRQVWLANIAVQFQDEVAAYLNEDGFCTLTRGVVHKISNQAAERFINLLCQ